MYRIRILDHGTQALLDTFVRFSGNPRGVIAAALGAVHRDVRRHFALKDKRPNKLGGRRTHFWAQVRSSTVVGGITNAGGTIVIGDSRFPQKLFGGTITAKNAQALTIPMVPEAHGRTARTYERETGIRLFIPKGHSVLAESVDGKLRVVYLLRRSVNQRPEPDALPTETEMSKVAITATKDYVERFIRRRTNKDS